MRPNGEFWSYYEYLNNGCPNDYGYQFSFDHWDVSLVTDFSSVFMYRVHLKPYTLANWNTGAATDMSFMFKGVTNANFGDLNWDVSRVRDMSHMFEAATTFIRIF